MALDEVDRELMAAEDDARRNSIQRHHVTGAAAPQQPRPSHEVERVSTHSSTSSSSIADDAVRQRTGVGMSRVSTQRDLERHPTELSRIHTARSQHSATVGRAMTGRTTRSRRSRPLPNFGAGKPYPPPLPEQEEYVVEFDGPDDPYHAQNWPMKKK